MKLITTLTLTLFTLSSLASAIPPPEDVVIVGGGLAGLTTAHRLKQSGIDAKIYERRDRLGGRVYTYFYPDGSYVELGAEKISKNPSRNQAIMNLTQELGVDIIKEESIYNLLILDGQELSHKQLKALLKSAKNQLYHALKKTKRQKSPYRKTHFNRHARPTVQKLIDTMNDPSVTRLFTVYYKDVLKRDLSDKLSRRNLKLLKSVFTRWDHLKELDTSKHHDFRIQNGASSLVNALEDSLEPNDIYLNHTLSNVYKIGEIYKLDFQTPDGLQTIYTKKLILTLPFSVLRDKLKLHENNDLGLPDITKDAIEFQEVTLQTKVIIPLKSKPWVEYNAQTMNGIDLDKEIILWDSSYNQTSSSITLYFDDVDFEVTDELVDKIVSNYDEMGYKLNSNLDVVITEWYQDEYLIGGNPEDLLHDIINPIFPYIYKYANPIDNSLYFAGDHIWIDRRSMNSSIASANYISKLISKQHKKEFENLIDVREMKNTPRSSKKSHNRF